MIDYMDGDDDDDDDDDFDDELFGVIDEIDELGRARGRGRRLTRRARSSRGRGRGRSVRRGRTARALVETGATAPAGLPGTGPRGWPLGLGSFTFVNAGVTANTFTASPQRPFKGFRLVVDVRRSSGAVGELLTLSALNVGQANQLVSGTVLPLEAFQANAFDVSLDLDPATPGIDITAIVNISAAPGVGETVAVSLMIIGMSVG